MVKLLRLVEPGLHQEFYPGVEVGASETAEARETVGVRETGGDRETV